MSRDADRFAESTSKLRSVKSESEGAYLYEYDAVLAENDESVRIITLAPGLVDNDAATDAFERVSGQWYNANTHPNIISIVERETTPRPWIALDQAHDLTLDRVQSQLTSTEIETVVTDTAEALRTLGLYNAVHGMLSPEDILVYSVGDSPVVQIKGFGLDHAIRSTQGEFEPTPYTAPELIDNRDQSTERTDVYGLGAITYFALTGEPPVHGIDLEQAIRNGPTSSPSEYNGEVSPALDDAVMRALSTRPGDRQDSPHAFKRAFLSAFDATTFETAAAETSLDNTDQKSDYEATEGDDTSHSSESTETGQSEGPDDTAGETDATENDTASMTRRATVGLLGIGTIGGVSWFLSRDQSDSIATDQTPASPSANITVTPTDPTVGEEVTFSAVESTTGEGVSLDTYEWAVGTESEFSASDERLTQSFNDAGEYTIRLRVTDSQDRTATTRTTLTIQTPTPTASMSVTPTRPRVGEEVTFSAEESTTPENVSITKYEWSVGSETQFSEGEQTLTQSFNNSGEKTIRLRLIDSQNRMVTTTTNLTVLPIPDGAPQFRYDSMNTGHAPEEIGPASSVSEQWIFQTSDRIYATPVVVDGTVYVGSSDNFVYAIDAVNGTEQWRRNLDSEIELSPAVVNDTVYIGTDDGVIYALNATDGTEKWTHEETDYWVTTSPTVVDNTVYIGTTTNIYAINASDGTERWRYEPPHHPDDRPNRIASPSSALAVANDILYFSANLPSSGSGGFLVALDAADGSEQWIYQTGASLDTAPTVSAGTVYVGGRELSALNVQDGTKQWSSGLGSGAYSSTTISDNTIYAGLYPGALRALDATDGTEQWIYDRGTVSIALNTSPIVVDETVYTPTESGISALDPKNGTEFWTYDTNETTLNPIVVDGTIYAAGSDSIYMLSN